MIHQIHPNKIRQILFISVLILLGLLLAKEMYFMLGAFLGATTLYVLLRNGMIFLVAQKKWKKWLAALTLMLISFVLLVVPLAWMASVMYDKVKPFIQDPNRVNSILEQIHQYLIQKFDIDVLNKDNVAKLNNMLLPIAQKTIGSTISALGNTFIMYLMLYFMLIGTTDVELWLRNKIPFKHANVQKIITELRNMVYSNALGIPLVALLQGLVGLIGYWIFGMQEFVLMGLLTAICSVIPVVGSMLIYIPLMIFQLSLGHTMQGIGIGLWGFILIGSIDNVARFMLQKKLANVHPLITLFGVFIGVNLFGFLGIIFGPLLIALFILLVKIYIDEFGKADADEIHLINKKG